MTKKILITFVMPVVIILGMVLTTRHFLLKNMLTDAGPTVTIELTEDGFRPSAISIKKGATVTFTTSRGKPFWPASDLHPTHTIYAAFDPKEPVQPDTNWSFKFEKAGEWKFHDHLFPYYRGTIRVTDGESARAIQSPTMLVSDCDVLQEGQRLQCWDEAFRSILKNQGMATAFSVLADLYKTSPPFASQCHVITHTIGETAYHEFKEKGSFKVGLETSYCGFGFFHGFMESLFADGNGPELARQLCDYMDEQVAGSTNRAGLACFHGIGHGAADGSAANSWGDEQAFVQPALDLCDKIAVNYNEKFNCATGAFNSLSIAYISNQYGMRLNVKDPLWICRQQKQDEHKMGCYNDMMVAIVKLADHDIPKGASYLNNVEDSYAMSSVRYVSALTVKYRLQDTDYTDIIRDCRKAQKRLQNDCISGFGSGLMEFGEPGIDYIKALAFCKLPGLFDDERATCISRVLGYAYTEYPKEKMKEICSMVNESYWAIPSCKPQPQEG